LAINDVLKVTPDSMLADALSPSISMTKVRRVKGGMIPSAPGVGIGAKMPLPAAVIEIGGRGFPVLDDEEARFGTEAIALGLGHRLRRFALASG
jgi:hypothetical protein